MAGEAGRARSQHVPCKVLSAGFSLCSPSLLFHLPDFLPVSWTLDRQGREEIESLVGRELPLQNQGAWELAMGTIFKRISLFVILIRDVIDCG